MLRLLGRWLGSRIVPAGCDVQIHLLASTWGSDTKGVAPDSGRPGPLLKLQWCDLQGPFVVGDGSQVHGSLGSSRSQMCDGVSPCLGHLVHAQWVLTLVCCPPGYGLYAEKGLLRPAPDRGVPAPSPGLPSRPRNSSQARGQPEANVGGLLVTVSEAWRAHGPQGGVGGGHAPQGQGTLVAGNACFLLTVSFRLRVGMWVWERV